MIPQINRPEEYYTQKIISYCKFVLLPLLDLKQPVFGEADSQYFKRSDESYIHSKGTKPLCKDDAEFYSYSLESKKKIKGIQEMEQIKQKKIFHVVFFIYSTESHFFGYKESKFGKKGRLNESITSNFTKLYSLHTCHMLPKDHGISFQDNSHSALKLCYVPILPDRCIFLLQLFAPDVPSAFIRCIMYHYSA